MLQRYKKSPILIVIGLAFLAFGCPDNSPPIQGETPLVVDTIPDEVPDTTTVEEIEPPRVLKATEFQTVYFDFDKFNLRSDARSALDANLSLLSEFPDVIIKIEGHADERGTIEYNLSLGEKRASATMDYLLSQGIDGARISIISYGKERPMDTGSNEDAWSQNRRCEFRIISQ